MQTSSPSATLCSSAAFFSCATQRSGVKLNSFLSGIFHKRWQGDREHPSSHNAKRLYSPKSIQAQIKQSVPAAIALIQVKSVFIFPPENLLITEVTIMSRMFVPDLRKTPENALKLNYPQSPHHQLFLSVLSLSDRRIKIIIHKGNLRHASPFPCFIYHL